MKSLEQCHAEMRGALILAGLRIRHMAQPGGEDPVLEAVERALRNSCSLSEQGGAAKPSPRMRSRHR